MVLKVIMVDYCLEVCIIVYYLEFINTIEELKI